MQQQLIDNRTKIKQFLLPASCVLCGARAEDTLLCAGCEADLPWHNAPHCPVCAHPTGSGNTCGQCLKHPPAFDATLALLAYRFPVNALLQRYKYSGFLTIASMMAALLARRAANLPRPDLLLPMPLHPARLKERGFNQAVEIGRLLGPALGIRMETRLARRNKATPPQANLTFDQRRRNVRGVFECTGSLAGEHVVLLDDVMTTGASLDALAQAVRKAGAARVECWVLARTLPYD